MKKYNLVVSVKHQRQPCQRSCAPTSIAMAVGVPVEEILRLCSSLGFSVERWGMTPRETYCLLVAMGIGYSVIPSVPGVALSEGLYLLNVASLNTTASTHVVLLHVTNEYECFVYDPQEGVPGKKAYHKVGMPAALSYLMLDDFYDI